LATERKWSDAVEQFRTVLNLTPSDVEARDAEKLAGRLG